MDNLVYVYKGKSRDLRKNIVALLKSGLAVEIRKVNYVHSFEISNNTIQKIEEKLVIISTEKEEKLNEFLSKNFSQFERISLK